MAITSVWTNALGNGVLDAAGNWTNGVPDAFDTAICDGNVVGPSVNMDQAGGPWADLRLTETFTGDVGTQGAPLAVDGGLTQIHHFGSGTLYCASHVGNGATHIKTPIYREFAAQFLGNISIEDLLISSGRVKIASTVTILADSVISVSGSGMASETGYLINDGWATDVAWAIVLGGEMIGQGNMPVIVDSGVFTVEAGATVYDKQLQILGGHCRWNARSTMPSNVVVAGGGRLDLTGNAAPFDGLTGVRVLLLPGGIIHQYAGQLDDVIVNWGGIIDNE